MPHPISLQETLNALGELDLPQDIEQTIELCTHACSLLDQDEDLDLRANLYQLLGVCFRENLALDRSSCIERSIEYLGSAIEIWTQETHPHEWSIAASHLGQTLLLRRAEKDCATAISLIERALAIQVEEQMHEDHALTLSHLGSAYKDLEHGDRRKNLQTSISFLRDASKALEKHSIEWGQNMRSLGDAYSELQDEDRAENIESSIRFYKQSLTALKKNRAPDEWAQTMRNLSQAYWERPRGNQSSNKEKAIKICQAALAATPRESFPEQYAHTLLILGSSYYNRTRGGRSDNIEEAIRLLQQSLEILSPDENPHEWADAKINLAVTLSDRLTGNPKGNCKEGIRLLKQALQVHTKECSPLKWAEIWSNMGTIYQDHDDCSSIRDLEKAIKCYRRSLQVLTPRNAPFDWAMVMMNLGTAFQDREAGHRSENLSLSLYHHASAGEVWRQDTAPADWARLNMNIGEALAARSSSHGDADFHSATDAYQNALKVYSPDIFPHDCRRTALALGNLFSTHSSWNEASQAYDLAMKANENLYRSALLLADRQEELFVARTLYHHAAYACAKNRQISRAIEIIETARARVFGEAADRDRANLALLEAEAPELFRAYQEAAACIHDLESEERLTRQQDLRDLRKRSMQARVLLTSIIAKIRHRPRFTTFLHPPSSTEIRATVKPGQALLYLLATAQGCLGLMISHDPSKEDVVAEALWFRELTSNDLDPHLQPEDKFSEKILKATLKLDELLPKIAERAHDLQADEVTLIPCGQLGAIPFHTAMYQVKNKETCLLDKFRIKATPSARLLRLADRSRRSQSENSTFFVGLGHPLPPFPHAKPLHYAHYELETVAALFPRRESRILTGPKATIAELLSAMPAATHVHIACHGEFHRGDPMGSSLELADGTLSLRMLLHQVSMNHVQLIVLSACNLGADGERIPDESIGFPAGLIQAGAAGVIASQWPVNSMAASILMTRFYKEYLQEGRISSSPTSALRRAQLWLRHVTAGSLINGLRAYRDPLAARIVTHLALFDPAARPFEQPGDWSNFLYIGA